MVYRSTGLTGPPQYRMLQAGDHLVITVRANLTSVGRSLPA